MKKHFKCKLDQSLSQFILSSEPLSAISFILFIELNVIARLVGLGSGFKICISSSLFQFQVCKR